MSVVVKLVRFGLPAAMAVAGCLLFLVDDEIATAAGVALIGAAALVVIFNLLTQLSMSSQGDRDAEEAAREYYARHGRWPEA